MKIDLYELLATVSPGGIQTTYWETARRLGAWGHEVHLYGGEGPIRWEVPETDRGAKPGSTLPELIKAGRRY